jgi:hypothetical protein
MVKLASFPLAAGIICLLSPQWLLVAGIALVVLSLALIATH